MYILRENMVETTLLMSHTKQWDNTHTTITYIVFSLSLSLSPAPLLVAPLLCSSVSNFLLLSALLGVSPVSERVRLAGLRLGVWRVTLNGSCSSGTTSPVCTDTLAPVDKRRPLQSRYNIIPCVKTIILCTCMTTKGSSKIQLKLSPIVC